jgi:hypothetical protein
VSHRSSKPDHDHNHDSNRSRRADVPGGSAASGPAAGQKQHADHSPVPPQAAAKPADASGCADRCAEPCANCSNKPHHEPPAWAGDWTANNVVDRRSGIPCRRGGNPAASRRAVAFDPATGEPVQATEDAAGTDASGDELADLSRRRGAGRRLSDFTRCAEEGDFNREQFLFVMAMDGFKRANGKTFPTWTDVLEVIRLLGYRKTCKSELNIRAAEDWTEHHDVPSNVRSTGWDRWAA